MESPAKLIPEWESLLRYCDVPARRVFLLEEFDILHDKPRVHRLDKMRLSVLSAVQYMLAEKRVYCLYTMFLAKLYGCQWNNPGECR